MLINGFLLLFPVSLKLVEDVSTIEIEEPNEKHHVDQYQVGHCRCGDVESRTFIFDHVICPMANKSDVHDACLSGESMENIKAFS